MNPVAASATFWETDNFSAGRERSLTPAMTRAHFAKRDGSAVSQCKERGKNIPTGAQKKIVLFLVSIPPVYENEERTWDL